MHGHLLGLPVRAVRLLMVFHTKSFDHVRHLQHILLECLWSEQQQNWMFDRMFDPCFVLWPNPFHKLCQCVTCGKRKEQAVAPNFSYRVPLCKWHASLPYFLPVPPAIKPFNTFCRGNAGTLNDKWHFSISAVFRSRFWRTQDSLLVSINDLEQLECRLECRHHAPANKFQHVLCAILVLLVPTTLLLLIWDRCSGTVSWLSRALISKDKRRHCGGNSALTCECPWIPWRSSFACVNFFRCIPLHTFAFHHTGCQVGPGLANYLPSGTTQFPLLLHKTWPISIVFENPPSWEALTVNSCCHGWGGFFTCSAFDSRSKCHPLHKLVARGGPIPWLLPDPIQGWTSQSVQSFCSESNFSAKNKQSWLRASLTFTSMRWVFGLVFAVCSCSSLCSNTWTGCLLMRNSCARGRPSSVSKLSRRPLFFVFSCLFWSWTTGTPINRSENCCTKWQLLSPELEI